MHIPKLDHFSCSQFVRRRIILGTAEHNSHLRRYFLSDQSHHSIPFPLNHYHRYLCPPSVPLFSTHSVETNAGDQILPQPFPDTVDLMPGPQFPKASSNSTSLSITNPLVLYRTLVATNRLKPDPAQHRLALQLQKLYFRLKDYRPEVEYRRRLERVTRGISSSSPRSTDNGAKQRPNPSPSSNSSNSTSQHGRQAKPKPSFLAKIFSPKATAEMKALLPSTPLHDTALTIDSPQGILLYGEVGRGKSMLLDLLYNALPSDRKRRWHFSTFMLDVFRRLEMERVARSTPRPSGGGGDAAGLTLEHEHVVLSLARDTVETSPLLFLDEFQMPDRASSRLVNGFLTGFFGLGGVLVASSNRMPEELSRGVGVRFVDSHMGPGRGEGKWGRGGWIGGLFLGGRKERKRDDTERFVDVLKARCEVWEMEGAKDWRREVDEEDDLERAVEGETQSASSAEITPASLADHVVASDLEDNHSTVRMTGTVADTRTPTPPTATTTPKIVATTSEVAPPATPPAADSPPHYHLSTLGLPALQADIAHLNPTGTWRPFSLTIYGRTVTLPQTYFPTAPSSEATSENSPDIDIGHSRTSASGGVLLTPFAPLLTTPHGPADYVSLASHFHSVILTDVPVLTASTKNEARRLIWLIDALYEAGCRLVVGEAEGRVDGLFFPEGGNVRRVGVGEGQGRRRVQGEERLLTEGDGEGQRGPRGGKEHEGRYESDAIESEAMSEMYQDSVAPFRANVSSYDGGVGGGRGAIDRTEEWRSADPTFAPSRWPGRAAADRARNVLADEDADFGPTYGNGRGHGVSASQEELQEVLRRQGLDDGEGGGLGTVGRRPDFTDTRVLVGEDERFAYKRARSRLWEMCGRRWWRVREVSPVEEWWRPEGGAGTMAGLTARFWEGGTITNAVAAANGVAARVDEEVVEKVVQEMKRERETERQGSHDGGRRRIDEQAAGGSESEDGLFRHGASPYRTSEEAPPKLGWQHAWGMMTWGKKAGEWGKGVDGDRRKEGAEKEKG